MDKNKKKIIRAIFWRKNCILECDSFNVYELPLWIPNAEIDRKAILESDPTRSKLESVHYISPHR